MDPQLAAHRLNEIALLLEVRGENPFKSRAFAQAARTVGELEEDDIAPLVRSKEIAKLPGIGATTMAVLADLVENGESSYLESLKQTTPTGLIEMMRVPGLGPTRIHRLHEALGIASVEDLEAAVRDGRVARVSGFGVKTAEKILKGIATFRQTTGQLMHVDAIPESQRLKRSIGRLEGVARVEVAGALRRTAEVVSEIELVASCEATPTEISTALRNIPGAQQVDQQNGSFSVRLVSGTRVNVHCAAEKSFSIALWRHTGSVEHCQAVIDRLRARGFSVENDQFMNAEGRVAAKVTEEELYRSAGLAYVPLELRENRGEIDAAADNALPRLVELDDLRGVLHCHSNYSDGKTTIAAMAEAAQHRGWTYLGVSDHSQAASYAGGLERDRVLKQHDEIDELNQQLRGFRVLKGIEADILADGSLDYGDELLDRFDYVIGSVHSRFGMGQTEMTERILRAMRDPRLTIVGHPTGRLLLRREPFAVDLDAIIDMAAEQGIALEFNCDPNRLDLDWRWLQIARQRGVTIEIGPDAHAPDELSFVEFGMAIARKGWLEKEDVLNTRSADDVLRFARARRAREPSTRGA